MHESLEHPTLQAVHSLRMELESAKRARDTLHETLINCGAIAEGHQPVWQVADPLHPVAEKVRKLTRERRP